MDNEQFQSLDVLEQVEYVNKLLVEGQSLTNVTKSLGADRRTLTRNFKKASYVYNSTTKQFVKSTIAQELAISNSPKLNNKNRNKTRNVSKTVNKTGNINEPIIINKFVSTTKPKRTSYYLNVATVKKIEKLAKESNKGISEFLQELLDMVLDKIEIK